MADVSEYEKCLVNGNLYQRFGVSLPSADKLAIVTKLRPIQMICWECKAERTWQAVGDSAIEYQTLLQINQKHRPRLDQESGHKQALAHLIYQCTSCHSVKQYHVALVHDKLIKYGEYPPAEISVDSQLSKAFGPYLSYYRQGLMCERHGFGIAAMVYYRRVVEGTIADILVSMKNAIGDEAERATFEQLLDSIAKARMRDRIAAVRDALPPSLLLGGHNPLEILYRSLGSDIHQQDDDTCLAFAGATREALTFMIRQIDQAGDAQKRYSTALQLLNRKVTRADDGRFQDEDSSL